MNKIIYVFLSAFMFLAFNYSPINAQSMQSATVEEAQVLITDGAILVDVREDDELLEISYQADNMMQIPLSELNERINELPTDKKLIMACRSGNRSAKAIKILQANGYEDLVNLEGGIKSWQAKGYAVVVDGVAPAAKACCANSGKGGGEKGCSSKKGQKKACCAAKKSKK